MVALRRLGVHAPVRSAESELLDTFLVSAVATVLVIRLYLAATDYPQLGANGVHIAHVLFGGFGMLVAMILLLGFLSAQTRHIAALVGGAGFGAFIDEIGKFVTSDNNYFFRPTAALLYVTFVVLFLVVRQVRRYRGLTARECLVNAVQISEQLVGGDLDVFERARALDLLSRADQADPAVAELRERFLAADVRARPASRIGRAGAAAATLYARAAASIAFRRVIIALFGLQGAVFLVTLIGTAALIGGAALGMGDLRAVLAEARGGTTLTNVIQLIANAASGALIVLGIVWVRRSRLYAYRAFELAILIDLLLYQPFAFLDNGFAPTVDVVADVALLAVLRYLKALERQLAAPPSKRAGASAAPSAGVAG
jgi:hypothetical protein